MIYSPSKTEAYDTCSLKGKLMYTDHWELREASNGTVGKIVGAAFARGTQSIHLGLCDYVDTASRLYDRQVNHYVEYGVTFSTDMGKVKNELIKTLERYKDNNPFTTWKITGVEFQLPEHGRARLDVVGIDNEGYSAIADLKYKRTLNPDYLNKTVSEYRDSWQFLHYPWAYSDMTKEKVHRMWVVLVVASPFKVLSYPFFVNEQLQKRWVQSAHQKWSDILAIEKGERQPTMAAKHGDQYGPCPMKEACLEMDLNEGLMQFKYVKVPRLPDE